MPDDRAHGRVLRGPRRRQPLLPAALAFAVLLVLGACASPAGQQAPAGDAVPSASATGSPAAAPSGESAGWKVFRAGAEQWQVRFSLMQVGPPWRHETSLVSYLRPGAEAPVYKGELPVNTLIAPARPTDVHPAGAFGWRTAPDIGVHELHNGADLAAADGSPVVAAMDGVVRGVFWNVWGGNRVEVAHVGGLKTTYNHLSTVQVKEGDTLEASQQLGRVGMTGARVTGPHLHFETWVDDEAVDPQTFDWIVDDRVIPAPRKPGQEVGEIPLKGLGDQSSLENAKDCPYTEDDPVDCSAPDAVTQEEKCSEAGGGGSDCPGGLATQRQECIELTPGRLDCDGENEGGPGPVVDPTPPVGCPEGGLGTPECPPVPSPTPSPSPVGCPEGGLGTPECPLVPSPTPSPSPVGCPEGGLGTPECPTTPPAWPPPEQCAATGTGGLDCPPAGPGPEDCPAPAGGRTDCPLPQTVPEASSATTGSGADPAADPAVRPLGPTPGFLLLH